MKKALVNAAAVIVILSFVAEAVVFYVGFSTDCPNTAGYVKCIATE